MICEIKALRSSTPRVLVVEDEPLIRFAIADALRDEGVSVIEAATGDEAWEHLQIDSDIDIIFTDPDAWDAQRC
jgi:CheY-like chemotaxis protein